MNVNEIASLGSNVKPVIRNENCSVHMLNDTTGEGVMTIYRVMPGVMICFSDIHMEQCVSEFELKNDRKIFCIDHCREGRIEMEVKPGVFSIMQENELRLDNRENHKGTTYYPLKHYHGVSVFMEVTEVQKALDEMFHGFSVSIEELSSMYEIPLTTMKKCFKDVYGDSIYSYQKRYRMNLAANMLLQDKEKEVQEIAASVVR